MAKVIRKSGDHVPRAWRDDLARVLITENQLASRVAELAREITRDFTGRDTVVVAVLNGTVMFLADLLRHLAIPLRLDFVGVSSYASSTTSGEVVFTKPTRLDVRGRDVLVIDDILDTGKTLDRVITHLRQLKPRRLRTCVLLDKKARRQVKIRGDYTGFQIPDEFVVGYGLDFAERYRNLPFVGILRPEVFQSGGAVERRLVRPAAIKEGTGR
jgi:hypoxanthine phosphoribosyltransferase